MRKNKRLLALITVVALVWSMFTQYGAWIGASESADSSSSTVEESDTEGGEEDGSQKAESAESEQKDELSALSKRPQGDGPVELTTSLSVPHTDTPNVNVKLQSVVITASTGNWDLHPYKDGVWSDTGHFNKYREIKYSYTWDIPDPHEYKVGDYFLLPLSEAGTINYMGQEGDIIGMRDGSSEKFVVGRYSVIELPGRYGSETLEYAKIELNQEAIDATRIRDGEFYISARVNGNLETGVKFVLYGPQDKRFHVTAGSKVHKTLNNIGLYQLENRPDFKKYSGKTSDGRIEWYIEMNRDNFKKMFKGQAPIEWKDLYIEDDLPNGTSLYTETILLIPLLYVPYGGNDDHTKPEGGEKFIGNTTVDWYQEGYRTHFNGLRPEYDKEYGKERVEAIRSFNSQHFNRKVLKPTSSEEYDSFKARVLREKQAGVYTNADGTQKLVIYIGDNPSNITYYNMFNASLTDNGSAHFDKYVQAHENAGRAVEGDVSEVKFMNALQVEEMKKVYGSDNSSGGRITGFRLAYKTDVKNKNVEGGFYNSVSLWHEDRKLDSSEKYQFFASSGGSANLEESLILHKKWESNDQAWIDKQNVTIRVTPIGMRTGRVYEVAKEDFVLKKSKGESPKTWTLIAKDMVRMINGEELRYEVEELIPSGAQYELKDIVKGAKKNEFIITNTKKGEAPPIPTVNINVTMVDCADDIDHPQAPSAEVHLVLQRKLEGGNFETVTNEQNNPVIKKIKANAKGDDARVTFIGYDKVDQANRTYVYTVKQVRADDNGNVSGDLIVAGYREPAVTSELDAQTGNYNVRVQNCKNIDVRLMAVNCQDEPTAPPVNMTFKLQVKLENQTDDQFADVMKGHRVLEETMLSTTSVPTLSFFSLPKFDPDTGLRYLYRVVRTPDKVNGYVISDSGNATAENHYNITVKICKEESNPIGTGNTELNSGDDGGTSSGTQPHVERITPPNNTAPNTSGTTTSPQSDVAGNRVDSDKPDTKVIDGTQAGGPDTHVLPGVIPGLNTSGTNAQAGNSVKPLNQKNLPKTGEGLNIDSYAIILLLCGATLLGYGIYKKKKGNN